jgi:hypothetical protein
MLSPIDIEERRELIQQDYKFYSKLLRVIYSKEKIRKKTESKLKALEIMYNDPSYYYFARDNF